MGVSKLTRFVEERKHLWAFQQAKDGTPFVVDGAGFTAALAMRVGGWEYGGETGLFKTECLRILRNMLQKGITLLFLFDGAAGKEKDETAYSRTRQSVETLQKLMAGLSTEDQQVSPPFMSLLVFQCLRELEIEFKVCDGEADVPVAVEASKRQAFVVASDSDLMLSDSRGFVMVSDFLNHVSHWRSGETAAFYSLPRRNLLQEISAGVHGFSLCQFPLLATLAGNDYLCRENLTVFHDGLYKKSNANLAAAARRLASISTNGVASVSEFNASSSLHADRLQAKHAKQEEQKRQEKEQRDWQRANGMPCHSHWHKILAIAARSCEMYDLVATPQILAKRIWGSNVRSDILEGLMVSLSFYNSIVNGKEMQRKPATFRGRLVPDWVPSYILPFMTRGRMQSGVTVQDVQQAVSPQFITKPLRLAMCQLAIDDDHYNYEIEPCFPSGDLKRNEITLEMMSFTAPRLPKELCDWPWCLGNGKDTKTHFACEVSEAARKYFLDSMCWPAEVKLPDIDTRFQLPLMALQYAIFQLAKSEPTVQLNWVAVACVLAMLSLNHHERCKERLAALPRKDVLEKVSAQRTPLSEASHHFAMYRMSLSTAMHLHGLLGSPLGRQDAEMWHNGFFLHKLYHYVFAIGERELNIKQLLTEAEQQVFSGLLGCLLDCREAHAEAAGVFCQLKGKVKKSFTVFKMLPPEEVAVAPH
eukprot:TRINITY_DN122103_c0_g1_i1.p1 TRINITY_DN122103_c0_g1~~TRINITY_DN122103_c0_g1_i1.p1  ORF type:complete len:701 (-),score=128.74 TRINITY_DN122103_c0_g1_i1:348-2450(-)